MQTKNIAYKSRNEGLDNFTISNHLQQVMDYIRSCYTGGCDNQF